MAAPATDPTGPATAPMAAPAAPALAAPMPVPIGCEPGAPVMASGLSDVSGVAEVALRASSGRNLSSLGFQSESRLVRSSAMSDSLMRGGGVGIPDRWSRSLPDRLGD